MGAGHSHGHSHGTATGTHRDRPLGVLAITVSIMVAEVVGGLISGSLAVLADAGHMHHRCSRGRPGSLRPPSPRARPHPGAPGRTFGYMRLEILAAVINAPLLFDVAGYVLVEAVRRFTAPPKLSNGVMLSVAAVGLVANAGSLLLRGGQQASLNLRGAYLEVMGDLLGSVAVIVAAIIIRLTGCTQADAIASAAIGLMILPRTWALLREAVDVLPEATPKGVDLAEVRQHTNETPGVLDVYDLHAWTITSRLPVLSAHIVITEDALADGGGGRVLDQPGQCLAGHFDVEHCTFQLEAPGRREHELSHHA